MFQDGSGGFAIPTRRRLPLTTLTKTAPAPRPGSQGPAETSFTDSREPFRVQDHTVRPVAAGTDSARPARLLRHGCAGKSLYNDRGADKSVAPRCVAQAYGREDRRPGQLAHPHPVSRAQVSTDKEATTRGRTTATRHPNRSRRPTREAVRTPAMSSTGTDTAHTAPRPRPVRAKQGDPRGHGTRAHKCQGTLRSSRSSFGKSTRLPLGGFTHS